MKLLQQLISDGEMPSTMRVLALLVVAPVMLVWTVLCIRQNTFIIPDLKIVLLIVSAFGGKALQSFGENFSLPKPGTTPQTPDPKTQNP